MEPLHGKRFTLLHATRIFPDVWQAITNADGTTVLSRNLLSWWRSILGFPLSGDHTVSEENAFRYLACVSTSHLGPVVQEGEVVDQHAAFEVLTGDLHLKLDEERSAPVFANDGRRAAANEDGGGALVLLGLRVGDSLIPGAGRGLFASRFFHGNSWLCVYFGRKVSLAELLRRKQDQATTTGTEHLDYMLGGFGIWSVDAAREGRCAARYINHGGSEVANAAFTLKSKKECRCIVVALRDIEAGEEILVDYGDGYWRARGVAQGDRGEGAENGKE